MLRLQRNAGYAQEGTPEDKSPYAGAPAPPVRRRATRQPKAKVKAKPKTVSNAGSHKAEADQDHCCREEAEACSEEQPRASPRSSCRARPKEPLDEIDLATRAKQAQRLGQRAPERTPAALDHWLYQHNWIVSGAEFGWSHGAEALQALIARRRARPVPLGRRRRQRNGRPEGARGCEGAVAVILVERLRRLAADESGFTLPELLTSMAILLTIMTAFTGLLVSTSRAELDMTTASRPRPRPSSGCRSCAARCTARPPA